jgi:hypothetical protein
LMETAESWWCWCCCCCCCCCLPVDENRDVIEDVLLLLSLSLLLLILLRARIAGFQQVESYAARYNRKIGVKVVSKIQKNRFFYIFL